MKTSDPSVSGFLPLKGPGQQAGMLDQDRDVLSYAAASSAESCIREAVVAQGLSPGPVGLADTKAEDEAAARWADFAFAYGD